MSEGPDILATADRLLDVKRARGLSAVPPPPSPAQESPPGQVVVCVNCGYSQQGQSLDRCPECGLVFASRLRDSTPWTAEMPRPLGWWETARRVWLWDRRVRLRTSYLPVTAESRSFARWSIAASALLLGLALAVLNWNPQAPRALGIVFFLMQTAIATGLAALLLLAAVQGLVLLIRGTWRHHLQFILSSIHYATAWWPLLSLMALLACASSGMLDQGDSAALLALFPLVALVTWGFWLWGSVTESEHVLSVAPRIVIVAMGMYLAAAGLMLIVPGTGRMVMATFLDRTGASLLKLNVLGTYTSNPIAVGPRTCALFIDVIPGGDESLVAEQVARLGAKGENCVWIKDAECTLEQIDQALSTAATDLRPEDKFILYINGHGASSGSGSIRMANGELTSQKLTDLLQELPTAHCLVVIDSCFGGKFIPAFRDRSCDVVVITASDDRNVAFVSGLQDFWQALQAAESDRNGDGHIAVDEAFWSAFRPMLQKGEQMRAVGLEKAPLRVKQVLAEQGLATPQLEALGKACKADFSVPVPEAKPGARKPPPL